MNEATTEQRIALLQQRRQQYTMQAQTIKDDLEILSQTATDQPNYEDSMRQLTAQLENITRADKVAEGMLMVLENEEE